MRIVLLRDQVIDGEPIKANTWIEIDDEQGYRLCAKGRAEPFPMIRALFDSTPLGDLDAAAGDVAEVHPDVMRIRCEVVKDCEAVARVATTRAGFIHHRMRKAGECFEVSSGEAVALICEGDARYAPPPRGVQTLRGRKARDLKDGRIEIVERHADGRGGVKTVRRIVQDWNVDRSHHPFIGEEDRRRAAVYAD